jgi:hypothetical protein
MDRRHLLKILGASTALPALTGGAEAETPTQAPPGPPWTGPAGTPSDPNLVTPKVWWQKKLQPGELVTLAALCDTIIPADEHSPSASHVGVPDYINEWASAPYDDQRDALVKLRGGLSWLNLEAERRFSRPFARLAEAERHQIADDICYEPRAKPEFKGPAQFFDLVRDLTATGFYTTQAGMKDLKYIGNIPLPRWDGPPPEVLKHLGLE